MPSPRAEGRLFWPACKIFYSLGSIFYFIPKDPGAKLGTYPLIFHNKKHDHGKRKIS